MSQRATQEPRQSASRGVPDEPSSPVLRVLQRHPHGVVLACFLLSGATGLVYEVVWSRRLTLVFGVTVLAYSTVLATFLGGLALGSLIFGRVADRRDDHLRVYALLEGAVGLFCFATPWLFGVVEQAYVHLHPFVEHSLPLLRLTRFGLAAAVLVVPTVLMGGTLPILSRAVARRLAHVGREVGALYGINTLGAVLGALAAGFLLLPIVGLRGSIYLAAVVNLAIGTIALALYAVQGERAVRPSEPEPQPTKRLGREKRERSQEGPEPGMPAPRGPYAALLAAYGLSGAAALIYEVVWTRTLSLAFGTSVYAFSGMLAAFLAGLALGSLVPAARRWSLVDRLREPLVWFGIVEIAIAASVTFLTPLLDRMPFVFLALFGWIGPRFWLLQIAQVAVCFAVMLLPAALMGFAFPLVTRIATESVGVLGRRLSAVYASNTFGTVIGSLAAGFVLIPAIGARDALLVGVALNGLVGVAYLAAAYARHRRVAVAGLAVAGVAAGSWLLMPDWNKSVLSSGAYVYPQFYLHSDSRAAMEDKELLYYRDALTAAISVTRVNDPRREGPLISLQINGKTDASTADLSTQVLLAHLPALLCREPRSALVIGLASGCTLGSLELHPEFDLIDCVEIEAEMIRVTGFFRDVNHDCLSDPRTNLFLNDARNFVLVTRRQYDVLTSEPSNPWIAGVANLFTREHFELCRQRLTPQGIFCQWIPLYNLAPDDFRCIVGTFSDVFPHATLWSFSQLPTDAYLIGSFTPLQIDVPDLVARASRPDIAADLAAAGVRDVWDFLGGFVLGERVVAELGRSAARNTDDFPVLEFSSPSSLHTGLGRATMEELLAVAPQSQPPLGRREPQASEGCRSALLGLRFSSPWKVLAEEFWTLRSPETSDGAIPSLSVRLAARARCDLGGSQAEIHVSRLGEPSDSPELREPDTNPDRLVRLNGREIRVWDGAAVPPDAAWVARWLCPETERVYLVVAKASPSGPPVPPEEALRGVVCEHYGPAAAD